MGANGQVEYREKQQMMAMQQQQQQMAQQNQMANGNETASQTNQNQKSSTAGILAECGDVCFMVGTLKEWLVDINVCVNHFHQRVLDSC